MIDPVDVPPLVGRREAAEILGVQSQNLTAERIPGLPKPLQGRKIRGFDVRTGPLWPRAEIIALAKLRRSKAGRERLAGAT